MKYKLPVKRPVAAIVKAEPIQPEKESWDTPRNPRLPRSLPIVERVKGHIDFEMLNSERPVFIAYLEELIAEATARLENFRPSVSDPQGVLDGTAKSSPRAVQEVDVSQLELTQLDTYSRPELIAWAHSLGALEVETRGKPVKTLRKLVTDKLAQADLPGDVEPAPVSAKPPLVKGVPITNGVMAPFKLGPRRLGA